MWKMKKHIRGIICGVFFIGMSVQVALGIVWAAANFASLPGYPDSSMYVEMSKTFLCDEYTGILYPAMLMLARGIAGVLPIRYYSVMYLVQLTVSCYASHRFLRSCGVVSADNRRGPALFWDIWCTLCLMTIPMIMQCHMAVLPNSLTLSFFMVMISFVLEAADNPQALQARTLVRMTPLWLAAALMMPEYKYLAGVPILCLFLYSSVCLFKQDKIQILRHGLVILAFLGIIGVLGSMTQVAGSQGKMHKSLSGAMVSRFVWPNFQKNYPAWPEEVREIMSSEYAGEISLYSEGVQTLFGPLIEEAVGVDEARRLYWEMVRAAGQLRLREVARDSLWDAASYAASPWMLERQLAGEGYETFSGKNYEIMSDEFPGLSVRYMRYGNRWFCIGVFLALFSWLGSLASGLLRSIGKIEGKRTQTVKLPTALFLFVTSSAMVVYYTCSGAGIMDYKNSVFITMLWYAWMLQEASKRERRMNGSSEADMRRLGQ